MPPVPSVPGGIPIVGQAVYMACGSGHVEKLAGPFTMVIPSGTDDPIVMHVCRVCWVNFVGMFRARPLGAAEIEELTAAGGLEREAQ